MNIYTLYIKTHKVTGLKYLGQTSKNPYKYKGSGIDWVAHLQQFGKDIHTEILLQSKNKEEINSLGRYYSILWHIVTASDNFGNKIWANRINETGGGGNHTEERKELFRQQQLGKKKPPRTNEHTEKIAAQTRGKANPKTAAGLKKWHASNPDKSKSNKKRSDSIKEWYLSNPGMSHIKSLKTRDGTYKRNYEKYKMAISFIAEGKTNREITKLMKIDCATINKLRTSSHRVFELFQEFKQLMSAKIL